MKIQTALQQIGTKKDTEEEPATVVIAGAGIVGLVLALALKKHCGITAELYEKAHSFHDDVGAALGFYPNGMRVLRDIDYDLFQNLVKAGYPYLYRRWSRHDGTEIATAEEAELTSGDEELMSIGIRRWRLQKVLFQAVEKAGIPLYYNKATVNVKEHDHDDLIDVVFEDGTTRTTRLLFATDGGKSTIRTLVADPKYQLSYTGVTCLMGISQRPSDRHGIDFPSSTSSEFHAVYFPTGENEQCFQIHFPIDEDHSDKTTWGNLSPAEGKVEFDKLAESLEGDGWHERYTEPLSKVEHAVRVGFAIMNKPLDKWVYGKNNRIILVGDSAHPPVPYVGQGAQMGVEDAGTVALLIKHLCTTVEKDSENGEEKIKFDWKNFSSAMKIYEQIRIPRTSKVLDISKMLGDIQDQRSHEEKASMRELIIKGEVEMNGTLPELCPGATHDYQRDVMDAIMEEFQAREENDLDKLLERAEQLFDEEGGVIDETQYHNENLQLRLKGVETYDPRWQSIFQDVLTRY